MSKKRFKKKIRPFQKNNSKAKTLELKRSNRSTSSGVEALVSAIQNRTSDSACIRIPRSLDGRMQGDFNFSFHNLLLVVFIHCNRSRRTSLQKDKVRLLGPKIALEGKSFGGESA